MPQTPRHSLPLIFVIALTTGCSTFVQRELLSAPVVSMTHSQIPENYKLKVGRSFISKFCEDDPPLVKTGKLVGMADQAIYQAQEKHKATHLLDVRISREGECVIAEGNAARALRIIPKTTKNKKMERKTAATTPAMTPNQADFEWTEEVLAADALIPIED